MKMFLIILVFLKFLNISSLKVQLTHRSDNPIIGTEFHTKYRKKSLIPDPFPKILRNNYFYTLKLKVGSKNINTELTLDTLNPFPIISRNEDCYYRCSKSSSCKESSKIYDNLNIKGRIISEKVHFFSSNITIRSNIVLVNKFSKYCGVLGLSRSSKKYKNNFINTLFENKIIRKKLFAVYLTDNPINSELSLGEFNKSLVIKKKIHYYKAIKSSFWMLSIKNVFLDDINLDRKTIKRINFKIQSKNAILSYIDSKILLSKKDFNKFIKFVNVENNGINCRVSIEQVYCYSQDFFDKNFFPSIVINFENGMSKKEKDFKIFPTDYIRTCFFDLKRNSNICLLDLMYSKGKFKDFTILGQPFLIKFYAIFDEEKNSIGIGLAKIEYDLQYWFYILYSCILIIFSFIIGTGIFLKKNNTSLTLTTITQRFIRFFFLRERFQGEEVENRFNIIQN